MRSVESGAYRIEAQSAKGGGGGGGSGSFNNVAPLLATGGASSGKRVGRRGSVQESAAATEQSMAEAAIVDIKRVLDHESAELYRESQRASRNWSAAPADAASAADSVELRELFDELLRTEDNYLRDMRFAVTKFGKPLRELLDAAQTKTIFSNLAQILELQN